MSEKDQSDIIAQMLLTQSHAIEDLKRYFTKVVGTILMATILGIGGLVYKDHMKIQENVGHIKENTKDITKNGSNIDYLLGIRGIISK